MATETVTRAAVDAEHDKQRHEQFVEEAGEYVGEMPPQPVDNTPAPLEELRVDGTTQLGMFKAGGKAPGSASVRLAGGKVDLVDGRAFQKGDVVRFEVTAVIDEIGLKDKADSATGIVVSCEQKHVARITDLRILEQD